MKILNTMLIKQSKIRILFIVLFLVVSTIIQITSLLAQEKETKRGAKSRIKKEKLILKLSRSELVKEYIIKAEDIIKIIKDTNHAIVIEDSIIEGGLDFTKLPKESLQKEKLPKDWSEGKKEKYIGKMPPLRKIRIVTNKIRIVNSEIRSDDKNKSIKSVDLHFCEPISFPGATFSGEANFQGVTFGSWADLQRVTFSDEANFQGASFGSWARFQKATFSGKARFRDAIFSDRATFAGATFGSWADLQRVTFSDRVDFAWITFSDWADFGWATFSGGQAHFQDATFNGEAHFRDATFSSGADFQGANFSGWAYFRDATFSGGQAHFQDATFNGEAHFRDATFSDQANFALATFSKLANFREAKFHYSLDFRVANIRDFADFRNAKIRELNLNSSESPTIIEGRIDFREAIISEAHFQDLILEKDIDFSDVQFGDLSADKKMAVVFRFITFESDAYFIRAVFAADTAFERINFEEDADFTDAVFSGEKNACKHKLLLSYLNFQNLLINWNQLPNPEFWVSEPKDLENFGDREEDKKVSKANQESEAEARKRLQPLSQVIKRLEANFRSRNQLGDANEAYYHMKNAELTENRREKDFMEWFPAQVHWIVWRITCGYGTRIYQVLVWCIIFNLLFTTSYYAKGHLKQVTNKDDSFKLRLLDFPHLYFGENTVEKKKYSISEFASALKFSSVILFKIGYRDTTISGNIMGVDYKYIVWMEWLLGFYLLASLVVTLSNTVPLLHRLITGVF
jgi:hypothetical protein